MRMFIIICLVLIIIMITGCQLQTELTSKTLTPKGEQIIDTKQMQKDLKILFEGKYSQPYIDMFNIKSTIPLTRDKDKEILSRAYKNESDQVVQIVFEDKKTRSTSLSPFEAESYEIVTREAIKFAIYLLERDYDPTIKAVLVFYRPKNFDLDAKVSNSTVISIEELEKEYQKAKNKGSNNEEIVNNLIETFIYYHEFE